MRTLLTDFSKPGIGISLEEFTEAFPTLQTCSFLGQINHPSPDCSDKEYVSVPDAKAAVTITDLELEGDKCYGKVEFTKTPAGNEARLHAERSARFSIRAMVQEYGPVKIPLVITWDLIPG